MFYKKRIQELEEKINKLSRQLATADEVSPCDECGAVFRDKVMQTVIIDDELTGWFDFMIINNSKKYCKSHKKNYDLIIYEGNISTPKYYKTNVDVTDEVMKSTKKKRGRPQKK